MARKTAYSATADGFMRSLAMDRQTDPHVLLSSAIEMCICPANG